MVVPGPLRPPPVLPTVELVGRENEKGKEYGEDNKEWYPLFGYQTVEHPIPAQLAPRGGSPARHHPDHPQCTFTFPSDPEWIRVVLSRGVTSTFSSSPGAFSSSTSVLLT